MAENNVCNSPAYLNSITLKKRFQLLNVPPTRYNNLDQSPYLLNYTQYQLDMRRKAEILEYNASRTNTKTNNYTKFELWKQLVSGIVQKRSLSQSFIKQNTIPGTTNFVQTCPSGTILYTPTYASDVPGPIVNLYNDPNVPLYMYGQDANSYAIINQQQDNTQFIYDNNLSNQDKYLTNYVDKPNVTLLTSIYIKNILTSSYTFTIKFPISIFMTATVRSTLKVPGKYKESFTLSFTGNRPFQPYIYYGTVPVNNNVFDKAIPYTPQKKSVTFDISMVPNPMDPNNNNFYANQYIGMYQLYQLNLQTQPGYIYDLIYDNRDFNKTDLLNITFPPNSVFDYYFENLSYGITLNVAQNTANTFKNTYATGIINKNQDSFLSIT